MDSFVAPGLTASTRSKPRVDAFAAALACVLVGEPAMAAPALQTPAARRLACIETIPGSPHAERLSIALARLSQRLAFNVKYLGVGDPVIRLPKLTSPAELVAALALNANVIARYRVDERCAEGLRLDTVWVLGDRVSSKASQPVSHPAPPHMAVALTQGSATAIFAHMHGWVPPAAATPTPTPPAPSAR